MAGRTANALRREKMEITVPTLVDYFIATKKTEGLSPKTVSWYEWLLGKFCAWLPDKRLISLTVQDARDFIASLQARTSRYVNHPRAHEQEGGLSPSTISAYVRTLKVFSGWLYEENYTKTNVLAKLKKPKVPDTIIEPLKPEEIQQIIGCISPNSFLGARLYAVVLLMLDTGLRASEVCTLQLEDVDLPNNELKVMGKGKKERIVPIGQNTKKAIMRYLATFRGETDSPFVFLADDGSPLSYNALRLMIERLAKRSGVERMHPHLLRHTFACSFLMAGGDLMSLKKILGHTSIEITQVYLKLTDQNIKTQHAQYSPMDRLVTKKPTRRKV